MAFKSAGIASHMIRFNSATSSDFLEMYEGLIDEEIITKETEPKHRTFAPSQMRCDRISWFRLRGTQPDKISKPDRGLEFTANVGTACHELIQERLSINLKDPNKWISVEEWVATHKDEFEGYEMDFKYKQHETLIDMKKPYPVRFACDGIMKFDDKVMLLEIKTIEAGPLSDLIEPMPKHIDQITCYATLLQIPNVLFLYQERQYGEMKCFEITITEEDSRELKERMDRVMHLAEVNIAPEGLPLGDPNCSQGRCPYYKVCKQWGR